MIDLNLDGALHTNDPLDTGGINQQRDRLLFSR